MDHVHLIVRATVSQAPKDVEQVKTDLRELVDQIGMKLLGAYSQPAANWVNPMATYCLDPENRGMTAIALIETSSITWHSWDQDEPNLVELDVYSCRCFDKEVIFDWLNRYGLVSYTFVLIDRGKTIRVTDQGYYPIERIEHDGYAVEVWQGQVVTIIPPPIF